MIGLGSDKKGIPVIGLFYLFPTKLGDFKWSYLHKSAAAATNAIRRSQTNTELAMLPALG